MVSFRGFCFFCAFFASFFLFFSPFSNQAPFYKQVCFKSERWSKLTKQPVHLTVSNGYNGPVCIICILYIFGRKSVNWTTHALALPDALHVMTSVDKVLLAAEIRKTWHVKSIVAANSSDCITWQAWKSLLDSTECQNIGSLARLTERFVCRVKGFSIAELRADILQWELQSFGFVAKLFTVITVMWVLSFLGKLWGFPLTHWQAPRLWL